MPGDALNTSISYLDVQFGALEFGSDANTGDLSNQDKYVTSESNFNLSHVECTIATKNSSNPKNLLNIESQQKPSQKHSSATEMVS